MSKILLIVGGSGFVGSRFVDYIMKKYPDYKVINFDKLTKNAYYYDLITEDNKYIFVKGDVGSSKDIRNLFDEYRPGYVINCSNESCMEKNMPDSPDYLFTNIIGTQLLLQYSQEYQVKKYIQVSTAKVYGQGTPHNKLNKVDQNYLLTENSLLYPNNSYAASKASAELFVISTNNKTGLHTNIVRSTNTYGPFQFPEKLLPSLILNTLSNNELPLYGDGSQKHDWLYIEDFCKALDAVLHHGKSGEIYNISSGEVYSNIEIAEIVLDRLGSPLDLIEFMKERPAENVFCPVSSSKIREEFGWKPDMLFSDGLTKTIEWLKENKDWVNDILSGKYVTRYDNLE